MIVPHWSCLILTYGWPWTGELYAIWFWNVAYDTCFISRFEFATNEFVNDVAIVSLETSSTETGSKDFIAVGTTINRGEDLAAKGAVSILDTTVCYWGVLIKFPFFLIQAYIFEIAEVVPDPALSSKRWYKLRLRCRDEAKGPVTAVCGFSGYLVSSMGQKVTYITFLSEAHLGLLFEGFRSRL